MTNELENAMNAIIDFGIKSNCWNLYDSYGEICVGCGCCSKDPVKRANARYYVISEKLKHFEKFDYWSEDTDMRKIQEKNVKSNIKYFKKKLRYYKKRVEELKNENNS